MEMKRRTMVDHRMTKKEKNLGARLFALLDQATFLG